VDTFSVSADAIALYRSALDGGATANRRPQAVVLLDSSLPRVGDPRCGSGTAGTAARQASCRCTGCSSHIADAAPLPLLPCNDGGLRPCSALHRNPALWPIILRGSVSKTQGAAALPAPEEEMALHRTGRQGTTAGLLGRVVWIWVLGGQMISVARTVTVAQPGRHGRMER
jgi:hypothetical protein